MGNPSLAKEFFDGYGDYASLGCSLNLFLQRFILTGLLIGRALAGNPPIDIANELRDLLLEEVYSQRQAIGL